MYQYVHSPTCDMGGKKLLHADTVHNPRGWENKVIVNTNEETVIKPTRPDVFQAMEAPQSVSIYFDWVLLYI